MIEPETITLRKLPPDHVLRESTDMVKDGCHLGAINRSAGTAVKELSAACYCRAEEYPAEYDKPAIDPGEGWRIYDQHKEGREPKKVIQFLDYDGKWKPRPVPECELSMNDAYRVPVTPQPDRLTELRQQGERQANRIKELEEQLQQARSQVEHETQFSSVKRAEMADQIASLQTQVRSAEEALRVEQQKHDETVMKSEQQSIMNDTLTDHIKHLESTCKPLRWERRKPTTKEFESSLWLIKQPTGFIAACEPGEPWPHWNNHDHICILPPIAEPEPERRMVTQRLWLVKSQHGWEEIWVFPEDRQPCPTWMETIRTDRTREVPE